MAGPIRDPTTSLIDRLLAEPGGFEFPQAVRLLELDGAGVARQPIGEDASPAEEAVRFRAATGIGFPLGDVERLEAEDGRPPALSINFLGLTGPTGVLPRFYSELVATAVRQRKGALRDFLDLFNHRLASLFYRAAIKYRLPLLLERGRAGRAAAGPGEDTATLLLRALVGLGTPGLAGRRPIEEQAQLFFAGHYARGPRSAAALQGILGQFFGVPATIEEFRGQWLPIAPAEQTVLAASDGATGGFCRLDVDAVAGERTWDLQSGFRITLGPVGIGRFRGFLPGAEDFRRLEVLVRGFVGLGQDFDLQLVLKRDQVPALRLDAAAPGRLGLDSWLRRDSEPCDRDDAVFRAGEL